MILIIVYTEPKHVIWGVGRLGRRVFGAWGVGRLGRRVFGAWGVGRLGRLQSYPIGASSNCGVLTLALTLASCLKLGLA